MAANEISITEVILNGIVFNPRNARTLQAIDAKELSRVIRELFKRFDQRTIDDSLVGGIAMRLYVQGRNTQNIELLDGLAFDNNHQPTGRRTPCMTSNESALRPAGGPFGP